MPPLLGSTVRTSRDQTLGSDSSETDVELEDREFKHTTELDR